MLKRSLLDILFRFLWDAHNCEESLSEDELGISANYLDYWNDLNDLWFLGMQVLNSLMPQVPKNVTGSSLGSPRNNLIKGKYNTEKCVV